MNQKLLVGVAIARAIRDVNQETRLSLKDLSSKKEIKTRNSFKRGARRHG